MYKLLKDTVLVYKRCYNQLSQTELLNTTELIILHFGK
jgi:hypothetical protein